MVAGALFVLCLFLLLPKKVQIRPRVLAQSDQCLFGGLLGLCLCLL